MAVCQMPIVVLFLFQVILFLIGILGPWREANVNGRLPLTVRMLLSFSLVVAAFAIWQGGAKLPTYAQWVAFGMLASFIGDLVMARLIPLPNRLMGGMIVFGIAHALYINAYVGTLQTISSLEPYNRFNVGLLAGILSYCSFTVFGWWFLIRNPQKDAVTNIGALVYGAWISVMASCALALAFALGRFAWLTALGGLLFVVSDFLIGVTDIRGVRIKNANDWIWLTYVAAQMAIVYSSVMA